eukprot:TRINITY_DN11311_c0_g1_i6.p1 TRINITY_DN11311_c0_g1~~TRINITY_DN11311_c0_g1_i6.p1  ORF type:complete len:380 (-),score=43.26 TRINITY_DN11311_c0_g1_i6:165-1250(-)
MLLVWSSLLTCLYTVRAQRLFPIKDYEGEKILVPGFVDEVRQYNIDDSMSLLIETTEGSYYYSKAEVTWFQGFGECERVNGLLFSPWDAREEEMIAGAVQLQQYIHDKQFWLGIHNPNQRMSWDAWKWTDGSTLPYSNWARDTYEPNYQNDSEWCTSAQVNSNSVEWYDVSCLNLIRYICYVPKGLRGQLLDLSDDPWSQIIIPDPPRNAEEDEESVEFLKTANGQSFKWIRTRNNYETSRNRCYQLGGDLAVLDSWAKERMVLGALAAHVTPQGWIEPWIGLQNRDQRNSNWNWKWVSGKYASQLYTNWATARPTGGQHNWCGTIKFKNEARLLMDGWWDRQCSNGWYPSNDGGALCEGW